MRILQVSTADHAGGAEAVSWQLFQAYRQRGHRSGLAVGLKRSDDNDVLTIFNDGYRNRWARACIAGGDILSPFVGRVGGVGLLCKLFRMGIGQPHRCLDIWQGKEDFHFPATWRLSDLLPNPPDILHCHNLHGGYFDLRALPWLSYRAPVVLTLHDGWLLSGHCAHSFDCERWKIGCGQCPDLTIYPAISRDSTAINWQRKSVIYKKSRLYVATPSRWLMERVKQSILTAGMAEARVVPNGVDLTHFHPLDRKEARASLGLPPDPKILLFTANEIRANIWKDYRTLQTAIGRLAERVKGQALLFLALGDSGPAEQIGRAELRFIPYQREPQMVARYYQAADLYLHASKADTFPNTILEALACGTPVVATAVGGIPEQVKGLKVENASMNRYGLDEATGFLTSPQNPEELAARIEQLLIDESLCHQLSCNAVNDARERFDLEQQVNAYLAWYEEIRANFKSVDIKEHKAEGA